ncbi:hypothetical protein Aduo_011253 [Ancylostoma duodenale]
MKSIISVAVLCVVAQVVESYLTSGFGGGIIGGGVYPSYPSYSGYPSQACCCCCWPVGGQIQLTTTPPPMMLPSLQISVMPCPCPPQQLLQQQQCCNFVSPYQVAPAVTATAAPIGVPDIVTGPCGEIIVPLFNPPVQAGTSQIVGK